MTVASISSIISYKSHVHHTLKRNWQIERGRRECYLPLQKSCRFLSHSLILETDLIWNVSHYGSDFSPKAAGRQVTWLVHNSLSPLRKTSGISLLEVCNTEGYEKCGSGGSHQRDETYYEYDLLERDSCKRRLKELDSYFSKLHYNMDEQLRACGHGSDAKEYRMESSSQLEGQQTKVDVASDQCKRKTTLDSLENYFGELNTVQKSKEGTPQSLERENSEEHPRQRPKPVIGGYVEDMMIMEPSSVEHLQNVDDEAGNMSSDNENIKGIQTDDGASDFYLINVLVAINIAVFLFEIASPIKNSDLETLSLPLVYGAKINKLILVGEWWRLLTPMFLHSGFLHVALSSWVLLTFGPQVCRGYGPFTFLLIYVLGGICGNLTSFIHTPELTVCGTVL